MMKFNVGDEVVVTQCTTNGNDEFKVWCNRCIKTQEVLTVTDSDMFGWEYITFKGVDWVLRPVDIMPFISIMENE